MSSSTIQSKIVSLQTDANHRYILTPCMCLCLSIFIFPSSQETNLFLSMYTHTHMHAWIQPINSQENKLINTPGRPLLHTLIAMGVAPVQGGEQRLALKMTPVPASPRPARPRLGGGTGSRMASENNWPRHKTYKPSNKYYNNNYIHIYTHTHTCLVSLENTVDGIVHMDGLYVDYFVPIVHLDDMLL